MSNEGNKTPRKVDETTKSIAGTLPAARPSGWKRLLSKRWVFPAAYMAAAAIIVTVLWLNAGGQGKDAEQAIPGQASAVETPDTDAASSPEAAPAAAAGDSFQWPVDKLDAYKTTLSYYDASAPEEERQAAMVEYDNTFYPHTAIDLARKDGKDFNVKAALGGKVTVAEQTPTNGYVVEIQHTGGYVTVYQSLKDLKVQVGQEVEQGDVIGAAGQSQLESDEGVHVHFEIRSNDQSVNPATLIKAE